MQACGAVLRASAAALGSRWGMHPAAPQRKPGRASKHSAGDERTMADTMNAPPSPSSPSSSAYTATPFTCRTLCQARACPLLSARCIAPPSSAAAAAPRRAVAARCSAGAAAEGPALPFSGTASREALLELTRAAGWSEGHGGVQACERSPPQQQLPLQPPAARSLPHHPAPASAAERSANAHTHLRC